MAHTISALKRVRESRKKYERNKMIKSRIKSQIKKVLEVISKKEREKTLQEFKIAVSLLDRAWVKGVLHKNHVARRKSRLAEKVNAFLQPPAQKS